MQNYYSSLYSLVEELNRDCFFENSEFIEDMPKKRKVEKFGLVMEEFFNSEKLLDKRTILYLENILDSDVEQVDYYSSYLYQVLKEYFSGALSADTKILIVGLGNQFMIADSLGAQIAKQISPTRHLKKDNKLEKLPNVSVFIPNVLGVTGIETSDSINAICNLIEPDKIIVIDSLCASSIERFSNTIQISNKGITPGAGINNIRKRIDSQSLNCEVVAIGVPLLIKQSTLTNFKNDTNIFTSANINELIEIYSQIISNSINKLVYK